MFFLSAWCNVQGAEAGMASELIDVINQEPTDDDVDSLMSVARAVRDATYPYITFSPKV